MKRKSVVGILVLVLLLATALMPVSALGFDKTEPVRSAVDPMEPNYTGLHQESDGSYYLYINGVWQKNATYIYQKTHYIKNGVWQKDFSGFYKSEKDGKSYLIINGIFQKGATYIYKKTYYIKDGVWRDKFSGFYKSEKDGKSYLIINGIFQKGATYIYKKTYYVKDGVWRNKFSGFYESSDGRAYLIINGIFQKGATYIYRKTYYVKDGVWRNKYTGFYESLNGKTYFIYRGKFTKITGLREGEGGEWYYFRNGVWVPTYEGFYISEKNGKYYYVKDGIWRKDRNLLYRDTKYNRFCYIKNGVWDKTQTVVAQNNGEPVVLYDANKMSSFNRSIETILSLYENAVNVPGYDKSDRSTWFTVPSSLSAPYNKGVVADSTLEAMGRMSNFYRNLVGLKDLTYNKTNLPYLQAQALNRNFEFGHYISQESKPSDMDQGTWDEGFTCDHNILAWGYTPQGAITGWLNEGYSIGRGEWDTLGHRFAIIGRAVKSIKYGYSGITAIGDGGDDNGYTQISFGGQEDVNGDGVISELDDPWNYYKQMGYSAFKEAFTSFPAAGYMPNWLVYAGSCAWHVQLDGTKLRATDYDAVAVKVTNLSTNESYTCTGTNGMAKVSFDSISFVQPSDAVYGEYQSTYRVEITGIKDVPTREDAKLVYEVKFFSN